MNRQTLLLLLVVVAVTAGVLVADREPPAADERGTVSVHYDDQAVVIATGDGVAIIRFTDAIPEGRKYVYRFLPRDEAAKEERGEGKVFEKYDRKPLPPPNEGVEVTSYFLTDTGGQLKVIAGKIALKWSLESESSGWLYFVPETEHVQLVKADDFENLDLRRFAK